MSKRQPFADRLTPKQVQQIFDGLHLEGLIPNWREYPVSDNGWIDMPNKSTFSDLSINIYHGGFVNQYEANMIETYKNSQFPNESYQPPKGDIVTLVRVLVIGFHGDNKQAIAWIKKALDMNGSTPPELEGGFGFAKDWMKDKNHNYTRIPNAILYNDSLTASEKIVWGAIFERCNGEDIYSHAGIRRISKNVNLATGTVQKAIKKLKELNLLIVKYRGKNVTPQKFPLVADKKIINKAKSAVSNSEHQIKEMNRLKSAVSYSEQGCSPVDTATVSNSELNNSQQQKPIEQEPNSEQVKDRKPRSLTRVFEEFLKAEKPGTVEQPSIVQALFKERYGAAPDFFTRYTALFRATAKTALYQYDLRLYELSLN